MIPQNILDRLANDIEDDVYSVLYGQFTPEDMSDENVEQIAVLMAETFRGALTEHFHKIEKSSEN